MIDLMTVCALITLFFFAMGVALGFYGKRRCHRRFCLCDGCTQWRCNRLDAIAERRCAWKSKEGYRQSRLMEEEIVLRATNTRKTEQMASEAALCEGGNR